MLDITVVAVGKLRNENIIREIEKFKKRIDFRLEYIFLRDVKHKNVEEVKKREFEEIYNFFNGKGGIKEGYKILLWEKGTEKTTLEFYNLLKNLNKKIYFIITGAFGPSMDLINFVDFKLSLSKMAFTHELAFLLLIEQLYRVYTLEKNIPYCK